MKYTPELDCVQGFDAGDTQNTRWESHVRMTQIQGFSDIRSHANMQVVYSVVPDLV